MKLRFGLRSGHRSALVPVTAAALVAAGSWAGAQLASVSAVSFLSSLGPAKQIASTVPANGDVNPYGLAVVGTTAGKLVKGDILVSNYNDKANVQGTGNTIVQVSPSGSMTTFAQLTALPHSLSCPGGIGLTTALSVLPGGWVVVGSLPASGAGGPAQRKPGRLPGRPQ